MNLTMSGYGKAQISCYDRGDITILQGRLISIDLFKIDFCVSVRNMCLLKIVFIRLD